MAIRLSPETTRRLLASIKRYAAENLDEEIGDLKAGLLLDIPGPLARGNWTAALYVSAAIYLVGAVCWLFLDPHTPIEQPTAM